MNVFRSPAHDRPFTPSVQYVIRSNVLAAAADGSANG
jgi:hypothetical protein